MPWLFILLIVFLTQETPEKQPKILFAETDLDFGVVGQCEIKSWDLFFLNDGESDLEILGITPDCSCLPALVSQQVIKPDQEGKITVSITSDREHGETAGSFTVHCNDPLQPNVLIRYKVMVEPAFIFDPPVISFGLYNQNQPAKEEVVRMTRVRAEGAKIKTLTVSSPHLECAWSKDPEGVFLLKLKLLPSMPPGRFKAQIKIETDYLPIPDWEFPCVGVVRGPVSVVPSLITLGMAREGTQPSATVNVTRNWGEPLAPPTVSGPEGYFAFQVREVREKECYAIDLKLLPNVPKGVLDKEISIRTQGPEAAEFKVRVMTVVH